MLRVRVSAHGAVVTAKAAAVVEQSGNGGSGDVHALLRLAAEATARSRWRLIGASSAVEASNFFLQVYRRRLGLAIGREMARHRLHRVPFVGVPRAAMNARMRRGDPGLGGGGPVIHPVRAVDFLGFQQHMRAHDVRVGA